jgi:hypothetical protein
MIELYILKCEIEETKIELQQSIERTKRIKKRLTVLKEKLLQTIIERQSNLKCWCQECCKKETGEYNATRVVVCPDCGNKRCPKSSNHKLECTNSNKPGQEGSIY